MQADNPDCPREHDMPLNDLVHKERVPTVGGESPAAPSDRFRPAPLSCTAMAFLQRALARHQHRRHVYRGGQLRVCVDGEDRWRFDPEVGVCGPCRVPLGASYVEIFGADADGELLLAVFPLPAPASGADAQAQHLSVTLEGGQTVAIEIALSDGTGGNVRDYVIQMSYVESAAVNTRGAEHPAVAAIPMGPRPETSMVRNPWSSASRRPDDPSDAESIIPVRDLVMVTSDRLEPAMAQLVAEFYPVIQRHYREIAGTTGTAEAVRQWLPMVKPLGPGRASGDHSPLWRSWRMVQAILAYFHERFPLQREVHLFVFFDAEIETYQPFREMLTASLVLPGAYWFPTPATARAYLHALGVVPTEISPQLGTFHDHEHAFAMAMQHMTAREHAAGLEILDALYNHIIRTGEQQSRIWLLPTVQAIIEQWQRSNEGATRSKERHITMNH
jgi:hypothetical protein